MTVRKRLGMFDLNEGLQTDPECTYHSFESSVHVFRRVNIL